MKILLILDPPQVLLLPYLLLATAAEEEIEVRGFIFSGLVSLFRSKVDFRDSIIFDIPNCTSSSSPSNGPLTLVESLNGIRSTSADSPCW